LDRKDIYAVVISTPDHWHAIPTVLACDAGKDVYVEKPLTVSIAEGRDMVRAARKNNRIVQTGSQQRSRFDFRYACELVRSGRIGEIQIIKVGLDGVRKPWMPDKPVPDCDPPEWLDYDFWLGPAPLRPYNPGRVHYHFRWWWDYSGGELTNWGAHHLDIVQWGLGTDESGPVEIEGTARYHEKNWFEVPTWYDVTYKYANGVKVVCGPDYQKELGDGVTFIGTKGEIHVSRQEFTSKPEEIIKKPIGNDDVHLYESTNHDQNWLDCIKSRELPVCDVAIGHRSATVCHLGNIAIRTGRKIKWDPAKEQIVGDEEANQMVRRPYRSPWKI
ncbi:MAG: Gfo/Idh/MocA family protein, partial [Pirellulaceae bacterium]